MPSGIRTASILYQLVVLARPGISLYAGAPGLVAAGLAGTVVAAGATVAAVVVEAGTAVTAVTIFAAGTAGTLGGLYPAFGLGLQGAEPPCRGDDPRRFRRCGGGRRG